MWHDVRAMVQTEGAATLYRGLRPTLWRDVPFSAIYWLVLEQLRLCWKSGHSSHRGASLSSTATEKHPPLLSLLLLEQTGQAFVDGAVAGMLAAACTTPFDLAKTRLQTAVIMQATETIPAAAAAAAVPAFPEIIAFASSSSLTCKHDGAAAIAIAYHQGGRSAATTETTTATTANTTGTATGTFHQLRLIAQTDGIAGLWRGDQARMLKVAPACAIMLSSYELGKRVVE